jgi:hypothetical protein
MTNSLIILLVNSMGEFIMSIAIDPRSLRELGKSLNFLCKKIETISLKI